MSERIDSLASDMDHIIEFEGCSVCMLMLRGHCDDDEFKQAVAVTDYADMFRDSTVQHGWCKPVPVTGSDEMTLVTKRYQMRGAWEATWVE